MESLMVTCSSTKSTLPTYFVRGGNLRGLLYYNNDIDLILYPALCIYIIHRYENDLHPSEADSGK